MNNISEVLEGIRTVGIAGHVHPDGDCVGSCMGLYLYLRKHYPEIQTDVYLEEPSQALSHIACLDEIQTEPGEEKIYDLFITCDASSIDRIGVAVSHFQKAKKTACIDHHISNVGFADVNHVRGQVGSASEVLYTLLDAEKVDIEIAKALYTGMIHDTGVFQYSSTSPDTMRIAGELMKTGFDFNKIIDESFYQKTFLQNKAMGRIVADSVLYCDGKVVVGSIQQNEMEQYGVNSKELDGVVSQLRLTKGVEAAVFIYELETQTFKISMRATRELDVSQIAVAFGGGGHTKAAGCTLTGTLEEVTKKVIDAIQEKLASFEHKGE